MAEEKKVVKQKTQNIMVESRKKVTATGVNDVNSFNSEMVLAETELGLLTVKGQDLKISKLNLDNNEMIIEGEVNSCSYSDIQPKGKAGLFAKMFK